MIDGVIIKDLKKFSDERGAVFHYLKMSDGLLLKFDEVYFSLVYPGAIKAWHIHKERVLNYCVPYGAIKLVLFDDRIGSKTIGERMELFIGQDNYVIVHIPPRVWNGFKGLGNDRSLVANCTDYAYTPDGITYRPFDEPYFNYDWGIKNK